MQNLSRSLVEVAGPEGTVFAFAIALFMIVAAIVWVLYYGIVKGRALPIVVIIVFSVMSAGQLYNRWETLPPGTAWGCAIALGVVALATLSSLDGPISRKPASSEVLPLVHENGAGT